MKSFIGSKLIHVALHEAMEKINKYAHNLPLKISKAIA